MFHAAARPITSQTAGTHAGVPASRPPGAKGRRAYARLESRGAPLEGPMVQADKAADLRRMKRARLMVVVNHRRALQPLQDGRQHPHTDDFLA